MIISHANNERNRHLNDGAHVPDYGPYAKEEWPDQDKGHAAMITRMDSYVGRLLDHLELLGLAENTLVIFTSAGFNRPLPGARNAWLSDGPPSPRRSLRLRRPDTAKL